MLRIRRRATCGKLYSPGKVFDLSYYLLVRDLLLYRLPFRSASRRRQRLRAVDELRSRRVHAVRAHHALHFLEVHLGFFLVPGNVSLGRQCRLHSSPGRNRSTAGNHLHVLSVGTLKRLLVRWGTECNSDWRPTRLRSEWAAFLVVLVYFPQDERLMVQSPVRWRAGVPDLRVVAVPETLPSRGNLLHCWAWQETSYLGHAVVLLRVRVYSRKLCVNSRVYQVVRVRGLYRNRHLL